MKYSVAKDILLYPVGMETGFPAEVVDTTTFYLYDIGGGRYVWRTRDYELEVGRVGAVFYGKVLFRILEGIYATHRSAMRRCILIRKMFLSGEIQSPPYVSPSHG